MKFAFANFFPLILRGYCKKLPFFDKLYLARVRRACSARGRGIIYQKRVIFYNILLK